MQAWLGPFWVDLSEAARTHVEACGRRHVGKAGLAITARPLLKFKGQE